jgi:nucleotide-binding universal stress UspA family protein
VDGTSSGRDAVALALLLAGDSADELMLIAVREEPLLAVALPPEVGWAATEKLARTMLVQTRDSMAPDARIMVKSDLLVWRALCRVVQREHRDLLVVGSAHDADDGYVRLGTNARELLDRLECPLAIAPSGMRDRETPGLAESGSGSTAGRNHGQPSGLPPRSRRSPAPSSRSGARWTTPRWTAISPLRAAKAPPRGLLSRSACPPTSSATWVTASTCS